MGFGSNKGFTPGDEGLQVAEADGTPDVTGVKKIVVSDGTLTDDSNGQVTIDTSGAGGAGDVVGPASAVDNAVARFDTTTGKLLQNSTLLVSDTAQIGVATDPDLIVPTSGSVTINIGDVSGSDFKVVAAGATGAGGHEILHVQGDTQRIGIGETAPSSKLHVLNTDKTLTLEKAPAGYFNSFGFDGNVPYMTYYGSTGMQIGYGESTALAPTVDTMFLKSDGTVGIGTTAPAAALHVSSSLVGNAFQVDTTRAGTILAVTGTQSGAGGAVLMTGSLQIFSPNGAGRLDLLHDAADGHVISSTGGIRLRSTSTEPVVIAGPPGGGWGWLDVEGEGSAPAMIRLLEDTNPTWALVGDLGMQQVAMGLAETHGGNQLVIGPNAHVSATTRNFEHIPQTNPTVFIQSNENPETDNTQWLALSHNQTDAILEVGKGSLVVTGAIGRKRGEPQFKIAYDGSNFAAFHVNDGGDLFLTSSGGDSTFSAASSLKLRKNGDTFLEIDAGDHLNTSRRFQLKSHGGGGDTRLSIGVIEPSRGAELLNLRGEKPRIGIGVTTPSASLHILSKQSTHEGNTKANLFQIDGLHAGTIMAVSGGMSTGVAKVDITGSLRIAKGEITALATTPTVFGPGFEPTAMPTVSISKINGEYVTTILLSVNGVSNTADDKGIIGDFGGAAHAYITQITTAVNGIVYKAEMSCVELPTADGGNPSLDVDLVTNLSASSQGNLWDVGSGVKLIDAGENYTFGMTKESPTASGAGVNWANVVDGYLFIANGAAATQDQYNAGKFVIKLYGADF
tara:strand:+ start:1013 stop:3385 length:2373 start_codon:yes stop_codon:yes gene_type:complete